MNIKPHLQRGGPSGWCFHGNSASKRVMVLMTLASLGGLCAKCSTRVLSSRQVWGMSLVWTSAYRWDGGWGPLALVGLAPTPLRSCHLPTRRVPTRALLSAVIPRQYFRTRFLVHIFLSRSDACMGNTPVFLLPSATKTEALKAGLNSGWCKSTALKCFLIKESCSSSSLFAMAKLVVFNLEWVLSCLDCWLGDSKRHWLRGPSGRGPRNLTIAPTLRSRHSVPGASEKYCYRRQSLNLCERSH